MSGTRKVGVVDYGTGNLKSVVKALEFLKTKVVVFQTPEGIDEMDALFFPGQGTFDQCMKSLASSGLDKALVNWIRNGRPYFGICLGLQVLFEKSEEGTSPGLGLFQGEVTRFQSESNFKIPHMGWNSVCWNLPGGHHLTEGLADGDQFYFVHSYFVNGVSSEVHRFETSYGIPFVSGILSDNCVATQFHPEKSQAKGLRLYRNFLEKML